MKYAIITLDEKCSEYVNDPLVMELYIRACERLINAEFCSGVRKSISLYEIYNMLGAPLPKDEQEIEKLKRCTYTWKDSSYCYDFDIFKIGPKQDTFLMRFPFDDKEVE